MPDNATPIEAISLNFYTESEQALNGIDTILNRLDQLKGIVDKSFSFNIKITGATGLKSLSSALNDVPTENVGKLERLSAALEKLSGVNIDPTVSRSAVSLSKALSRIESAKADKMAETYEKLGELSGSGVLGGTGVTDLGSSTADLSREYEGLSVSIDRSAVSLRRLIDEMKGAREVANIALPAPSIAGLLPSRSSVNSRISGITRKVQMAPFSIPQMVTSSPLMQLAQTDNVTPITRGFPQMAETVDFTARLDPALQSASKSADELGKSIGKIGKESKGLNSASSKTKELGKSADQAHSRFGNLFRMIKRIATYRMIRSALRMITDGFKEGTNNLYAWSKAYEKTHTFANTMDKLATSALYLKNALGTMVAPILNAIAPAIDWLVDKIVDAINFFNRFISVLTGADTYTAAKKVATSFDNTASSASKAAKAVKSYTIGIDELNIIEKNASSGGGGGSSGSVGEDWFETRDTNADSFAMDLFSGLKNALETSYRTVFGEKGLEGLIGDLITGDIDIDHMEKYGWVGTLASWLATGIECAVEGVKDLIHEYSLGVEFWVEDVLGYKPEEIVQMIEQYGTVGTFGSLTIEALFPFTRVTQEDIDNLKFHKLVDSFLKDTDKFEQELEESGMSYKEFCDRINKENFSDSIKKQLAELTGEYGVKRTLNQVRGWIKDFIKELEEKLPYVNKLYEQIYGGLSGQNKPGTPQGGSIFSPVVFAIPDILDVAISGAQDVFPELVKKGQEKWQEILNSGLWSSNVPSAFANVFASTNELDRMAGSKDKADEIRRQLGASFSYSYLRNYQPNFTKDVLDLVTPALDNPALSKKFKNTGSKLGQELGNGLKGEKGKVNKTGLDIGTEVTRGAEMGIALQKGDLGRAWVDALQPASVGLKKVGVKIDDGIIVGINSGKTDFSNAIKKLITGSTGKGKSAAKSKEVQDIGKYLVEGIIAGANGKKKDLEKAMKQLAKIAEAGFAAGAMIGSPSKLMVKDGVYLVQGLNMGIEKEAHTTAGVMQSWMNDISKSVSISPNQIVMPSVGDIVDEVQGYIATTGTLALKGDTETMQRFYEDSIIPILTGIATDARRQADKDEKTEVFLDNRKVTKAVNRQNRVNGYRFT